MGIDLGTTNSLLTYWDGEAFQFMEWQEGQKLLPSVATYSRYGVHRVGYEALAQPFDSGILASTKRLMDDPNQHIWGKITPLRVATDILSFMKQKTEQILGRTITACIITIPAYFDEVQRLATKTAANLAGLNVLRLIHEPTAAALAYGLSDKPRGIFAVYDFGGGTFDVSILSVTDNFFHILSTQGNTLLGGDDIDAGIVQHWYKQGHHNVSDLKKQATATKEELSLRNTVIKDGLELTRSDLSSILSSFLDKTFNHFDVALRDADVTTLNGILLVGGATKTYGLKEKLQERYSFPIYDQHDSETIVALGAGMHAHSLIFGGQHVLLDVTPLSLGIEMAGGLVEKIIHRNTPLPVRQEQIFTTQEAGQQGITFNIVQGERERAEDCRSLAKFTIGNLPPMSAGKARAHVIFQIDVDGLITVSAKEQITGQALSIQIESKITKEECSRIIEDAMRHAREDFGCPRYV